MVAAGTQEWTKCYDGNVVSGTLFSGMKKKNTWEWTQLADTDDTVGIYKNNPRKSGEAVLVLISIALVWLTIGLVLKFAVLLCHSNPCWSGRLCKPLGGMAKVATWNPCKLHVLGIVAIAAA